MGLYFSICGVIFLIIFMGTFFFKSYLKTKETRLYSLILIISFFGTFIDIFSSVLFKIGFDTNSFLYMFFSKSMLVYFIAWVLIFTEYVYIISDKSVLKPKSIFFKVMFVILSLLVVIFPITFNKTETAIYPVGIGVNLTYVIVGICLLITIFLTLKNIKREKVKKYIPIFLVIIMLIAATIVQRNFPDLFLINFSLVVVVSVMYFTIENPDMKVIEEIHRAKEISDNANEEKTMFLYNMTNEIRGITRDINKEADIILDETDNKKIDVEVIDNSAREIKGSTARFTTMTNEILDISNMDGASIRVYDEKYNIRLILDSLINIHEKKCNSKNISFRSNISSDIPKYLYGDGINLKKILDILLDNSVKYTDKGYVELDVNTIIKNDMVRLIINVEDSGIGIDSEKLGSLFVNKKDYKEENYDLNDTLYNVKKIITMMGGTIIPNSTYGKGTNMKIILDQKLVIDNNKLDEYEKRIDKKDILYVGSDGKLINKLFKNKEVDLEIIELGKEALDKIRGNKRYDLILLEDDIKPLSGPIIMKKLLMIKSFNTKVILLTGNNEYKDSYKGYGFSDVILEPIDEEIFDNVIDKYLK